MIKRYSRLRKTEEKRNIRRALIFIILTIVSLLIFISFGIPTIAKFAAFLTDLKKSTQPVEKEDTTPPAPPRLNSLPEATNELSVEIEGTTEPGVTVILFLNNKTEEILANKDGEFTYTFSLLSGQNSISLLARDQAGNESQKSDVYKIIYDNEPPELEIITPEDGSKYYGGKQRQVVIEGTTEEDVKVTINERLVVVDSDGAFEFATTLSEGENTFSVKAEDKAGNTIEKSLTLHFSL